MVILQNFVAFLRNLNFMSWLNWNVLNMIIHDAVSHSMAMGNLNKSKETTPMTTTALKVAP